MREDLHGDVKPRSFAPAAKITIEFAVEKMADVFVELREMIAVQYVETGDKGVECKPNWALYEALEQTGNGVLIMAREGGRAIGYAVVLAYRNPNSADTVVGSISTWFVEPRFSRVLLERALLRTGIEWAKSKNARSMLVETEYEHSAERLLTTMGFAPVKVGYRMTLEA